MWHFLVGSGSATLLLSKNKSLYKDDNQKRVSFPAWRPAGLPLSQPQAVHRGRHLPARPPPLRGPRQVEAEILLINTDCFANEVSLIKKLVYVLCVAVQYFNSSPCGRRFRYEFLAQNSFYTFLYLFTRPLVNHGCQILSTVPRGCVNFSIFYFNFFFNRGPRCNWGFPVYT